MSTKNTDKMTAEELEGKRILFKWMFNRYGKRRDAMVEGIVMEAAESYIKLLTKDTFDSVGGADKAARWISRSDICILAVLKNEEMTVVPVEVEGQSNVTLLSVTAHGKLIASCPDCGRTWKFKVDPETGRPVEVEYDNED